MCVCVCVTSTNLNERGRDIFKDISSNPKLKKLEKKNYTLSPKKKMEKKGGRKREGLLHHDY